jgi:7-cyano-7-deazaguanine synthase
LNASKKQSTKAKAVVLLSGGLDSATVLAIAIDRGFAPYALSFDYGQRHRVELEAAKRLASDAGVPHSVIAFDLRQFGGSALTGDIDVPKNRAEQEMSASIPVTYVPARNTIFLSFALGVAETVGAFDIFAGMNALDYSGYPDCRPEFVSAFQDLANLATKAGVEGKKVTIHTPLIQMSKAEIIQTGTKLGVNYAVTTSCYDPARDGKACGQCDSCLLRRKGFSDAGMPDPTRYQEL